MKKIFIYLIFPLLITTAVAQRTDYPLIGAQIFIEPGQTKEQIDGFFTIMRENNMKIGRIRMFGAHMQKKDGGWDFSLYDHAFDAAHRNGVKLFATLFPPTDELTDVGGFKLPGSKEHLAQVERYIEAVVTHFRDKPALHTWVLQNEPGTGGVKVPPTDLSREIFQEWQSRQKPDKYNNGYLKADFTNEKFLAYYTDWYLRRIAAEVDKHDTRHQKHINPHQILSNLAEYNFTAYEDYLSSLGASMHLSWHFGFFPRSRYPLGVSVMADVISENAGRNPFWITELQGGNVTASGDVPYCPTAEETSQYLWTGIAAGCEGVIFWTLNQRASAMEAGEWGMIDFLGRPSDRLKSASRIASCVERNADFFATAKPYRSDITLLYNAESLQTQRRNAMALPDQINEGRQADAPMKSLVAAYEAIASSGVTPNISSMERFDWNNAAGQTAIIADMVSLPSYYWEGIKTFVRKGGKLIVTGLSGFYDQNMHCILMNDFPLEECFGGRISEYKVVAPYFDLKADDLSLPVHLWKGVMAPTTAVTIANDGEDVVATRNSYGQGEVVWFPSLIELGGWRGDNAPLAEFYRGVCRRGIEAAPVRLVNPDSDVLLRVMECGGKLLTIIINKGSEPTEVTLSGRISAPKTIDGVAMKQKRVTLPSDGFSATIWTN